MGVSILVAFQMVRRCSVPLLFSSGYGGSGLVILFRKLVLVSPTLESLDDIALLRKRQVEANLISMVVKWFRRLLFGRNLLARGRQLR